MVDVSTSRARRHSQENPVSLRLRSRLFTYRVAIIITLLGGILLIGFGLALRSQYSEATMSSLPPGHLTWQLQVKGFVHNELNLTIEDLLQMPQTRVDADIYCLPSPEARQGYFHEGRKMMYVSRGIGTSHLPIRILRPPELTVLHF